MLSSRAACVEIRRRWNLPESAFKKNSRSLYAIQSRLDRLKEDLHPTYQQLRAKRKFGDDNVIDIDNVNSPLKPGDPKQPLDDDEVVEEKKRKLTQTPIKQNTPKKQTISYSPIKPVSNSDGSQIEWDPIFLLEPSYLRDPTDGSYWTIIRIISSLKPELSLEDASYVTLKLVNIPPTPEEVVNFPQQLVTKLDEELYPHVLEYQIFPPDRKQQYIRKVHKAGSPPHHVLIHWKPLTREEEELHMTFY